VEVPVRGLRAVGLTGEGFIHLDTEIGYTALKKMLSGDTFGDLVCEDKLKGSVATVVIVFLLLTPVLMLCCVISHQQ
jgi:hypothetical protein